MNNGKCMMQKVMAWCLIFVLLCTCLPNRGVATTLENATSWQVNPLYDGLVDPQRQTIHSATNVFGSTDAYMTEEEASSHLRQKMLDRENLIEIHMTIDADALDGLAERILQSAVAHSGQPTEGDYLRWHYGAWGTAVNGTQNGNTCYLTLTYQFNFYTTLEQEMEVTEKLQEVLDELDLYEATDYEKIRGIYDYICTHVTYDYENLENFDYTLKYTAYAALMNGTAVCQGYATLFYRMALMLGLDARVIGGEAEGGPHGWNIVKLGSVYYNLDSTWDSEYPLAPVEYGYFMCNPENFTDHMRWMDYDSEEFHAAYPMSTTNYLEPWPDIEISDLMNWGLCGETVAWKLDDTATLWIYGNGDMADYTNTVSAPWSGYAPWISKVVIAEGVTSIGAYAFQGCTALTEVEMPSGITKIGRNAFYNCGRLTHMVIPAGVDMIAARTFYGCASLQWVSIPDSVTRINDFAFYNCSALTSVYIPQVVTHIGENTFWGCDALWHVLYQGSESSWEQQYIGEGNSKLTAAQRHYGCNGSEVTDPVHLVCTICMPGCQHMWDDGQVSMQATCTEDGVMRYTCTICEETKEEVIAASGHDYDAVYTKPTQEDAGYTTYTCTNCGHSYVESAQITLGDVNQDGNVDGDDAIHLLYYTLFGDTLYPIEGNCDFDKDGNVDGDDAIYLLYYTLFGDALYPLN